MGRLNLWVSQYSDSISREQKEIKLNSYSLELKVMSKKVLFVCLILTFNAFSKDAAGASLFSDDFERGDFSAGGWTT